MTATRRTITLLALLLSALPATAADDGVAIGGTAFPDTESCDKDMKGKDCVLTLSIEGDAAKLLYIGMKAKAVQEECTGGMEKVGGGGLHCIKYDDKTYTCDFGYGFDKEEFTGSHMDC
ncbi:MAG: hypothetical protein JNM45_12685 [Rhizobiales bacterium]|nr:hypothetical protein [Hyphomicrobiales bacterium]